MNEMFRDSAFNQEICDWDTHNVKYMNDMFACSVFNRELDDWDVSNVISMECMFMLALTKPILWIYSVRGQMDMRGMDLSWFFVDIL